MLLAHDQFEDRDVFSHTTQWLIAWPRHRYLGVKRMSGLQIILRKVSPLQPLQTCDNPITANTPTVPLMSCVRQATQCDGEMYLGRLISGFEIHQKGTRAPFRVEEPLQGYRFSEATLNQLGAGADELCDARHSTVSLTAKPYILLAKDHLSPFPHSPPTPTNLPRLPTATSSTKPSIWGCYTEQCKVKSSRRRRWPSKRRLLRKRPHTRPPLLKSGMPSSVGRGRCGGVL